jgi:hypothetical protein
MIMFMGLYSEDPKQYDELFLQNYLKINVIPQIQRIRELHRRRFSEREIIR